jgi:hypothetical protein
MELPDASEFVRMDQLERGATNKFLRLEAW